MISFSVESLINYAKVNNLFEFKKNMSTFVHKLKE